MWHAHPKRPPIPSGPPLPSSIPPLPSPADVLLAHAGQDASDDFAAVGHSAPAIAGMAQFLIGRLGP